MKKAICSILAFAVLYATFFCFNISAFASQSSIEKTQLGTTNTYYEFDAQTKTLTITGSGATPSYYSNGANQPWYDFRGTDIEKVVVDEGITEIGNYFFYQVRANSIDLPKSLTKIGTYAFAYTLGVTSWDLAFGIKSIGSYAFYYCTNLTQITIPDTITSIGSRAFSGCSSLISVQIPYSVTSLGSYAFYQCSALQIVTFQSMLSNISIGSYCFAGCANLNSVSIPMNAQVSNYSFGYENKNSKYDGFTMQVYDASLGYTYAETNSIDYTIIENFEMQCGIWYSDTYAEESSSNIYCFAFTPDSNGVYNFYSSGSCDVAVEIKNSSNVTIAQNDDANEFERNFLACAELSQGETYYVYVSSVKSEGDFSVVVYPDEIADFSVYGSVSLSADVADYSSGNAVFDITETCLKKLVLTINFANGFSDTIYYSSEFDAKNIVYSDNQCSQPFTCGTNTASLAIDNIIVPITIFISHSYNCQTVDYTVDDDGYNVYTCILCGDSYNDDYVLTPSIKINGTLVFAENEQGEHKTNTPYPYATINVDGRVYAVNDDGTWQVNTFDNCDIEFVNDNGNNLIVSVDVSSYAEYSSVDYGFVAINGYDLTMDNKVNAKDYGKFVKEKKGYPLNYWQFVKGFLI